jgi:hypothetical protein
MIEIIGDTNSEEYAVALALKQGFAKLWPGIENSPAAEDYVRIAANVKIAGYKVSDIDVVVAAVFDKPRYFVPKKALKDREGKTANNLKIRVRNFVAAVEVKGQSSDGVRVAGDEVTVRYPEGWKSATDQNVKQVHALVKYFADQWVDVHVFRCLALQGLSALPRDAGHEIPRAGALALGFSATEFLTALVGVGGVSSWNGEYYLSSGKVDAARKMMDASIFREVVPSRLDRQRMDRIAARRPEAIRLSELLGRQRVHVRGHGGTGKTVLVLQAAHEAFVRHGKRVLILTYNVALAADIQRMLALRGIQSESEGGGIEVRTTMSFIYSWLVALKATTEDDAAYCNYDAKCVEAVEAFEGGALGDADIANAIKQNFEEFEFDAIVVDEAQDWPQAEADLLARLYGGEKIALADGRDQLVRGRPTNWKRTVPAGTPVEEKSLSRCLRMKRNLGLFANSVAEEGMLNWSVEPNDEAAGGRVILVKGSYGDHAELQRKLVENARAVGNEKIDFLHCVPPSNVMTSDRRKHSLLGKALNQNGYEVWDGVDQFIRHDFPRSIDLFRVVQYDSCRGLEGWVTVLEDFDSFWDYKNNQALAEARIDLKPSSQSVETIAAANAWRWAMIALTRPIDTLVIACGRQESVIAQALHRVSRRHADFIEHWY